MEDQHTQNKQETAAPGQAEATPLKKEPQPSPQESFSGVRDPVNPGLIPQQIHFPNGHQAQLVIPPAKTEAKEIVSALNIQRANVLFLIVGGSNDQGEDYLAQPPMAPSKETKARPSSRRSAAAVNSLYQSLSTPENSAVQAPRGAYLAQLFSRGIARTAVNTGAMIIDGGRQTGIMAMMGQGVVDRGRQTTLIGIAPAAKVTYPGGPAPASSNSELLEPNHTHFVLTEGETWGDEIDTMYRLATALASQEGAIETDNKNKLVVTILVNGGSSAKKQLLYSVRQGWPIVVIQGSGHLADEIAGLWQNRPPFIADPGLAEIVVEGKLHLLPLSESIDRFGWLIEQLLRQQQVHVSLTRVELAEMTPQPIHFSNKQQALLVTPLAETAPENIIKALGLEHPSPVLLLLGGSADLNEALSTLHHTANAKNATPAKNDKKAKSGPGGPNKKAYPITQSSELMDNIYNILIDENAQGTVQTIQVINMNMLARLVQLFRLGIGPVAAETGMMIIDGGRQTGIMGLMGQGVAERDHRTTLIGVAPAGKVTYPGGPAPGSVPGGEPLDSYHSYFVLTEGEQWGTETEMMYHLAAALAKDEAVEEKIRPNGKPILPKNKLKVTVLINGDNLAKKQLIYSVQRGWPVIVVKGSGGLADEIAQLWQEKLAFIPDADLAELTRHGKLHILADDVAARLWQENPIFVPDADLAEIINQGKLYIFDLEHGAREFKSQIERLLNQQRLRHHQDDITSVEQAWQTFAAYDAAANRQQSIFRRLQFWVLALGVFGTFLALTETSLENTITTPSATYYLFDNFLYYAILLIPITITTLAAAANEFSAGKKWILLRASAESIKKEIYRYRAKAEIYGDQAIRTISREQKLIQRINTISDNLIKGETKLSAIPTYQGPIPPVYGAHPQDDGLSFFTPDRYLTLRLEDQYNYYKNRTIKLEKQLHRLQWLIYIIGGAGTLLVALGFELWIAMTTALVTAFTTYLEYRQVEGTLIRYNRTAINLHQILIWWEALAVEEQADPRNIDKLVGGTETAIHSEHAAWVQEMQDILEDLSVSQAQQGKRSRSSRDKEDTEKTVNMFRFLESDEAEQEEEAVEESADKQDNADQEETPAPAQPRKPAKGEASKTNP